MIIITNGEQAVMAYSESQWLDAATAEFPDSYAGFRVNGNPSINEILGVPGESAAMNQAQVEALAVDVVVLR